MTKKVIDVLRKHQEWTSEIDGTIDEVIARLQKLKESTPVGSILILQYETEYGQWGDDDRQVIRLYDRRLETDQEYDERMTKEALAEIQRLDQKRAQLAALKKELGEE